MTPEAQRIAIAEACGWKRLQSGDWRKGYEMCRNPRYLPDYLNDLNAMHEAEKVLERNQCWLYASELRNILSKLNNYDALGLFHATASQRAEAFLRTLGKWKK
jgi:hypothetical protein